MKRESPVDGEEELEIFNTMLSGKTEERILLIEAQSGMGKTILLGEFVHRKPKRFTFAKVDFKGGGTSISELFFRLRDKLGRSAKFPNLEKELKNVLNPSIDIKSNVMVGKNHIDAYLSARDEQEREMRLSSLTEALFTDLRTFENLLIIFDTFEKSDDSVEKWITDFFLSRIQNSPNVFVVIGGQKVPEDNFEWDCIKRSLKGIPPEHWTKYVNSKGMKIHDEYIRACCKIFGGHPLNIKTHLDGYGAEVV